MDLPAFRIAASLKFDSANPKKFAMRAYDGGLLRLGDKPFPVVVDLKGMRVEGQVKALLDHNPERPVGHMESVQITDAIDVVGLISVEGADADRVRAAQEKGFQWEASIHAIQDPGTAEVVPRGQRVRVNGRDFTGPVIVARSTVLKEASFTGLGAGSFTSAAIVAALSWGKTMPPEADTTTENTTQGAAGTTPSTNGQGTPTVSLEEFNSLKASLTRTDASLKQANELLETARRDKVGMAVDTYAKAHNVSGDIVANLRKRAAEGNLTEKDAEYEVLKAAAPDFSKWQSFGHVSSGESIKPEVLEAALLASLGFDDKALKDSGFSDTTINAAYDRKNRNQSLHTTMGLCIRASGGHYSGNHKDDEYIRAAFRADDAIKASAGGGSTVSLSNILENVANKILLQRYEAAKGVWDQICAVRSLNDFKAHSMYRLDGVGNYKQIPPDGEFKSIKLADAKYQLQLDTYGASLGLNRQMMINDDLNAFAQIAAIFGDMASIRIEELVWVTILSNPSNFFHANNKNLLTGAETALSITALDAAKTAFAKRVDTNGKPILQRPDRLVVGEGNATLAERIYTSEKIADVTGAATPTPERNPMFNRYRPVPTPYIDNTDIRDQDNKALSGQSATKYFLFLDPAIRAAVNIGFLNGNRRPTFESSEADFDTLGMRWRSFHDFGVGMGDPTAAMQINGA